MKKGDIIKCVNNRWKGQEIGYAAPYVGRLFEIAGDERPCSWVLGVDTVLIRELYHAGPLEIHGTLVCTEMGVEYVCNNFRLATKQEVVAAAREQLASA